MSVMAGERSHNKTYSNFRRMERSKILVLCCNSAVCGDWFKKWGASVGNRERKKGAPGSGRPLRGTLGSRKPLLEFRCFTRAFASRYRSVQFKKGVAK